MRIMVTGSKGFIGRAVVRELNAQGHTAIPYDLPGGNVLYRDTLDLEVEKGFVTGIINLAGMLGTHELWGHEADAAAVNIVGAVNVYDVAAKYGIPVVQIGTGHKGQPNPYAITKACAEDLGLARAQWQGEVINIVRAYHVYGPGQPVGPPHGKASVNKFFPTFACRALTGMDLELCGGGYQMIDPVYVDDVAAVLVDTILHYRLGGDIVEAGTGESFTVQEVANEILAQVVQFYGSTSKITDADRRSGEPRGAVVVAENPECLNTWPYKVRETLEWYNTWLTRS